MSTIQRVSRSSKCCGHSHNRQWCTSTCKHSGGHYFHSSGRSHQRMCDDSRRCPCSVDSHHHRCGSGHPGVGSHSISWEGTPETLEALRPVRSTSQHSRWNVRHRYLNTDRYGVSRCNNMAFVKPIAPCGASFHKRYGRGPGQETKTISAPAIPMACSKCSSVPAMPLRLGKSQHPVSVIKGAPTVPILVPDPTTDQTACRSSIPSASTLDSLQVHDRIDQEVKTLEAFHDCLSDAITYSRLRLRSHRSEQRDRAWKRPPSYLSRQNCTNLMPDVGHQIVTDPGRGDGQ